MHQENNIRFEFTHKLKHEISAQLWLRLYHKSRIVALYSFMLIPKPHVDLVVTQLQNKKVV